VTSGSLDRRSFLSAAGSLPFVLPLLPSWLRRMGVQDGGRLDDRVIPADKGLDPAWVRGLFERGEPTVYRGASLPKVAMPIGGIASGQVYLTGDGRLAHWAVFGGPQSPGELLCEFTVTAKVGGREETRRLDATGFDDISFRGEWPFGFVRFASRARRPFPLEVDLAAWNPKVPLDAEASILPGVVLRYRLRNPGKAPVLAAVRGRLLNGAGWLGDLAGFRANGFGGNLNLAVAEAGFAGVHMGTAERVGGSKGAAKESDLLAGFDGKDYEGWTAEGEAFGAAPPRGTLPNQNPVSGFDGAGLVNSYVGGDDTTGRLLSPEFTIRRPYVNFRIGGGAGAGTRMDLLVDGRAVRTARGRNDERLEPRSWLVSDLAGKKARIAIVDEAKGGWGHVNVDRIELADEAARGPSARATFCLAALSSEGRVLPATDSAGVEREGPSPPGESWAGAVEQTVVVPPGGEESVSFAIAWHSPSRVTLGREIGNLYAKRFPDALAVARALAKDDGAADLFRRTFFDSTLPRWLLERLWMPVSTLATETCQLWAGGRFWAWEGVGCCSGTCTHVWNYEHALARLWPSLDRSVREMQDFGEAFDEKSGLVGFRGDRNYAADGQAGTILKAYRAHLMSPDEGWLRRLWPRIRKSLEFLVAREGGEEGLLRDAQPNTFDIDFEGANTFVGSLYLAALRAGEEMARAMGEEERAQRWRAVFERGSRATMERLFDGEYFVQEGNGPWQYGPGCLSDQLFGQGWAHALGLGYLVPPEAVRSALRAIWKYNWAPAVGPYNRAHPPERWFLGRDDPGLLLCTWPKGGRDGEPVRYRDEVWTGIEYQVAGHMVWEGMLEEALVLIRAVHDRYDGARRNPWNEVECGDHYARAMASHGCLLALCGFAYDGPAGRLAFSPRLGPEDFRAFFAGSEGWGTLWQKREGTRWVHGVDLVRGRLRLAELGLAWPVGTRPRIGAVLCGGRPLGGTSFAEGRVRFTPDLLLEGEAPERRRLVVESVPG
jgi:uncharacterized protein (DUF608 family)